MADQTPWKNRIVDIGTKPASEFLANPWNWRLHPSYQREGVQGSLEKAGWTVTEEYGLLIDRKTLQEQMSRDGHGAVMMKLEQFIPSDWLNPVLAPLYPQYSKEIAFLCEVKA